MEGTDVIRENGDIQKLSGFARSVGFSHFGPLESSTIRLRQEVRDMCAVNKCHRYGTNWACPPGCGEIAELAEMIAAHKFGLIVQTTGELEDPMDYDTMMETAAKHKATFDSFVEIVSKEFTSAVFMGSGTCSQCETCTYPDEPCRFPETRRSSMEACGMLVSDVCTANGIGYYYGKNTITYTGCVLV